MITPAEFPYITSIHVNDCYTYQNFDIDLVKHQPFSHLILTGKNGSGKSTILKKSNAYISSFSTNEDFRNGLRFLKERINDGAFDSLQYSIAVNNIKEMERVIPYFSHENLDLLKTAENSIIYSFLLPYRKSIVNNVSTPTKEKDFEEQLKLNTASPDFFIQNFKQFLVNKKVNQAFAQLDNNQEEIAKTEAFFKNMEKVFGNILEDNQLKLIFEKESYEFFIELGDGRKPTFNVLPDGFFAFLSILMDLFTRLDLVRKSVGNFTYDPCGIVLIDEPETHLHLSLQYQVLPILTKLFPNVQFIVATHSPAVISSIKNVTVFDLTSKETMSDEAVGKSFSELMVSHFGLDNEFSSITDEIFDEFNTVLKETRNDIDLRKEKLKQLMRKHDQYISPTMRFELEAKLSE